MKKIFDVNALDLAKVGKAFGFAVPPRVNVNLGGGKSHGRKRVRESDDEDGGDEAVHEEAQRRQGKERRIETLGRKRVEKEVYRKDKHPDNWSR